MQTFARLKLLGRYELGRALSSRWFFAYCLVFLIGGLVFALLGMSSSVVAGYRGFVRATAGIAHLSLLVIPVMALLPSVGSLADDQESGTLEYVLAQPVTFAEVYLAKWFALAITMIISVTAGIGGAAGIGILRGMPVGIATALLVFVILMTLTFVSIGTAATVITGQRQRANVGGLVLWLILLGLGSLGVFTAFIRWGLPSDLLMAWSFVNPIEAFRTGLLAALDTDLSLLGPVGVRIIDVFGPTGTVVATGTSLALWALFTMFCGLLMARKRGGLNLL